jgi:hypothetical protein
MDKLEYIPGDLVKFATNTYTIVNFEENFLYNKICYALISTNSTKTALVADRDILPIPLTHEILEKNGWKSINGKYALKMKNANYVVLEFTEDGIYTYINENTMLFTIKYIHELQHLLYALHIDSNLKI